MRRLCRSEHIYARQGSTLRSSSSTAAVAATCSESSGSNSTPLNSSRSKQRHVVTGFGQRKRLMPRAATDVEHRP